METGINTREIRGNIFSMIIPISVEGLLQMIASTILMGMIGRLDVHSINAWGLMSRLTQVLWAIIRGISLGVTIGIASDLGAGNRRRIQQIVLSMLGTLFAFGLVFAGLLATFAPQFVALLGGSGEMAEKAVAAARICCISLPFWTVMLCTSGILQGHSNAKVPMMVMTVYNFACAGIGYLLIYGSFGLPRLEIYGAALTLVIAQIVMSAVCLIILGKYGFFKNIRKAGLTPVIIRENIARILRYGLPPAVENLLWNLGSIAMLRPILHYGDYAYAAHQLGMQAEAISYMPTMGFGIATSSLLSRSFGAGKPKEAEAYFRKIVKYITLVTVALIAIIFLARYPLMGLLTNDPEIIYLGTIYLITVVITLMPSNLSGIYMGALRVSGYTKSPMIFSIIGLWCVRVPLCYISAYLIPGSTIVWIWAAMGIDLVTRYSLGLFRLKHKRVFEPSPELQTLCPKLEE